MASGRWITGCRVLVLALPGLLGACAGALPAPCPTPAHPDGVVWLLDQGWHTEIGMPAEAITGPLAVYRSIFPGVKVLMFGFGKRTFITARVESPSELLMGPFPGPGAIQVVGLNVSPDAAYGHSPVVRLPVSSAQANRLSDYIWKAIGKTHDGQPRLISVGLFPGSLFYAATHGYAPGYTCNTWSAEALQAAGLAVSPDGVMFAGGVLDQTARLGSACLMPELEPH